MSIKFVILFLGVGLLSCNAQSQQAGGSLVRWLTLEEALRLNASNPRKIFIDIYTDWCGWCKAMDERTFNNPVIAKYLNENFHPVKFNAESREPITFQGRVFENRGQGRRSTHDLAAALLQGRIAFPSVVYLDENNQLLTSVSGFSSPSQIEPILVFFAENHYKTTPWETFRQTFRGRATD